MLPNAYWMRGVTYGELGQHQRGIEDLDKIIQLYPYSSLAYEARGLAYRELGEDAKADADRAKACSLDNTYC